MTILALDQSSHITGYAVFKDNELASYGKFSLTDQDIGKRFTKFRQEIQNLIDKHEPDYVVFEDIQQQNNVTNNIQTFKILAGVYGVLAQLLSELNIPYSTVFAATWKPALGISAKNRAAQKKQAQKLVLDKYGCNVIDDVADAICIGNYYFKSLQCAWSD